MKPHLLIVALMATVSVLHAQEPLTSPNNLVVNHSFELVSGALNLANNIDLATGWNSPNQETPKLYTTNSRGYVHDEYGSSWDFQAYSGKNVAAMNVYGLRNSQEKREYIQGSLREPLTVGRKYYFSFWVHYHCEGANNIGIAFLPQKIDLKANGRIPLQPATYQTNVTPYSDSVAWTIVIDSFIAYKPFQNFVIGNFFSNEVTKLESDNFGHHFAYIDDVVVEEAGGEVIAVAALSPNEQVKWEINEGALRGADFLQASAKTFEETGKIETLISPSPEPAFPLETLYFDYNSDQLPVKQAKFLKALGDELKSNPFKKIILRGYASSEGSDQANLELATRRAKKVREYLLDFGINPQQIRAIGVGETSPAVPNNTEENRKLNRRVELEMDEL